MMTDQRKSTNGALDSKVMAELCMDSPGERLEAIIKALPPDEVTLAEIRDLLGQDGLLLLTIFLTIVFLIPVSIPGTSTVFGAAIMLIGVSRFLNRSLWLPTRFLKGRLPADRLSAGLQRGVHWFHRLERVSRSHRLKCLACNGFVGVINNCAIVLGSGLLMAPFGFVPFSNTLPALAILFFAIGLLQRDGICILLGHLANIITMVYFTILIAGGATAVYGIFNRIL
jgi:hypothetical protein